MLLTKARKPRLPKVIITDQQFTDVVERIRELAGEIETGDAKERARVKTHENRIHTIHERAGKKRESLKERVRFLLEKAIPYATANKDRLVNNRAKSVATLPSGNALSWGTGLSLELPEDLDVFFEEMKRREKEDQYVRIKKEPNRLALRDSSNEKEVETFETVELIRGPRIQLRFPGVKRFINAFFEKDGVLKKMEVREPRS